MEYWTYGEEDHVGELVLNRPPVNAISYAVVGELARAIDGIRSVEDLRVLIISGGSKHFSAGVDIRELAVAPPGEAEPRNRHFQSVFDGLEDLRVPTIAAINGYALGGGLELALRADLRVAAGDAFLGLPEIRLGGVPGIGGMQRVARIAGEATAKRLVLTGMRISAEEGLRLGLIDEVAKEGGAETQARALAQLIAANPPLSVRAGKHAIQIGRGLPVDVAEALDLRFVTEVAGTDDRSEALHAFLERRDAVVRGR